MTQAPLEDYLAYFHQAEVILIVLSAQATFDQQLAASSLYLSLIDQGKKAHLLGVKAIKNSSIKGLENLHTQLGNDNLLISFPYQPEAVDNVSYHLDEDNQRFYLTIKPKKGCQPLSTQGIEYEYVGANADLIVLFDVSNLDDLNQLYLGYESVYDSANVLLIGASEPNYRCDQLDISTYSCVCELVYLLLVSSNLSIDPDVATNLLAGIQYETNDFLDPRANARTFESIARLLELGARRKIGGFSSLKHKDEFGESHSGSVLQNKSQSGQIKTVSLQKSLLVEQNVISPRGSSVAKKKDIPPVRVLNQPVVANKKKNVNEVDSQQQNVIRPASIRR